MPVYAAGNATALAPGDQALAFSAENVKAALPASAAFATQRAGGQPYGESWELIFSAAPGAFQVDVQHADTDADVNYVTMNSVTAVNTNQAARIELPACWSKFSRLKVVSLTNDVQLTARFTR